MKTGVLRSELTTNNRMENHAEKNDVCLKSKLNEDLPSDDSLSNVAVNDCSSVANAENHIEDLVPNCQSDIASNEASVNSKDDLEVKTDEVLQQEDNCNPSRTNSKLSSDISRKNDVANVASDDDDLLAGDPSDVPLLPVNEEDKLLEDNDSDDGNSNKPVDDERPSSATDVSLVENHENASNQEQISLSVNDTLIENRINNENSSTTSAVIGESVDTESTSSYHVQNDNSETMSPSNNDTRQSEDAMDVDENSESSVLLQESSSLTETVDTAIVDAQQKEIDKSSNGPENESSIGELIGSSVDQGDENSSSALNCEASSEKDPVDSALKNVSDTVDTESSPDESSNVLQSNDVDDTNPQPNSEVLHVDENEDDLETEMNSSEKDPFATEPESSTLPSEVETKSPENEITNAETETFTAEDGAEVAIIAETSSDCSAAEKIASKIPKLSVSDAAKTAPNSVDPGSSSKEIEEGNCIIPDTNEGTLKEVKVINKQVRKFDITPVRLEKLMDPSKLAAVKLESDLSKNALVSGRPQRQAAKKAETQIKEIVAQTDCEPEEAEQNAVCCRCSRLRMCKYIPSTGSFVCVDSCYQYIIDKKSAPAIVRILPAIKGQQSMPLAPKPSTKIVDSEQYARKCAFCGLNNIVEEKSVSWEAMDFCNEECINRYQVQHGSFCAFCNSTVLPVSMGKYAVRFGLDARQFCSGGCLEEFKKGLKSCSYCQTDISNSNCSVSVPVGEKQATIKDFCSTNCAEKYELMSSGSFPAALNDSCTVCANKKLIEIQVLSDSETHLLCSDACFRAFKFGNNMAETNQCAICKKFYREDHPDSHLVYHDESCNHFCSKICMNLFILFKRKIVPCSWCKVKKYNFDMIRKTVSGGNCIMMCSLNCLTLYQVSMNASSTRKIKCDLCSSIAHAQYHLTMSDATIRNFCSYNCVMVFQTQYNKTPLTLHEQSKSNLVSVPVPVVNTVSSKSTATIANGLLSTASTTIKIGSPLSVAANSASNLPTVISTSTGMQIQKQTKYIQQIIVKPPEPKACLNKFTQCRPNVATKGVSCRPATNAKECQTDEILNHPPVLPIPVPIYVPVPLHMYTMPFPVPVPFPLPIPVPIFIPTSQKTFKGIMSQMKVMQQDEKEIMEKIPSNPYEADLLLMAKMVAGEDKADANEVTKNDSGDDDDTHFVDAAPDLSDGEAFSETENSVSNNFNDEMLQTVLKMASEQLNKTPTVDLEAELTPNTITPQTQVEENGPPPEVPEAPVEKQRTRKRAQRSSTEAPTRKRTRSQQVVVATEPENHAPPIVPPKENDVILTPANESERPDASMCLKYTIGVRAWKQWVIAKNEQIEQAASSANKKAKLFNTNILKLTTDELNYLLCLFVREVRKPNGMEYAPDTIYYLCLSIQQYLFENGRIDNIFSDSFYEPFTNELDEVARKFSDINDATQYIVTRVEEEHLWESKQLGAHSPHVLLATLMFFNTKFFNLATLEEHMQLSFSHIMKHWKRNPNMPVGKPGSPAPNRNVVLRFYPPQAALDAPNSRKKKVYEQHENETNPLRCPVKLYEFYLSKCPESVKQRNDVFYLQPERSCVPDSPVWYSTMPLQKDLLIKMLHRIRMVKEVNISLLAS